MKFTKSKFFSFFTFSLLISEYSIAMTNDDQDYNNVRILKNESINVTFRDAGENDLPALNMLMRASKEAAGGSRYTKEYLDEFMKQLSVTPQVLAVSKIKQLFIDEKLAGFYSFYINDKDQLELDNFFLDPSCLYKGYGKILWSHCLNTAKEYKDKECFVLWSSLEAVSFYLKRGCVKIGEKPSPADVSLIQPMFQYNLESAMKVDNKEVKNVYL